MILLHRLYARNFKQLSEVTLHFPEKATILIEGHNEAGKSSLFEAVYFALYGQTLASDRDYKLEDLRSYDADVLEVELDFSVDGRRFFVARKIGKNHTVKLICPTQNGETETISSRSEATRRLLDELRLTPDALLNTCFVEQKRLERLEDLNAESRRNTINELLNLRVLTQLETDFKVTREDREELQRLRGRLDIARLDADLPTLEVAEQHAGRCLHYVQLVTEMDQWQNWQQEIEQALRQQQQIQLQQQSLARKMQQVAELKGRLISLSTELTLRVAAWQEAMAAQEQAASQVEALELLATTLPEREQQLHDGTLLQQRLACLEEIEARAIQLSTALEQTQVRLSHYDQIQQAWESDEIGQRELAELRSARQVRVNEIEARLQSHQQAKHRANRLALLLQHQKVYENTVREADQIKARLQVAQAQTPQLSDEQLLLARAFQELEALNQILEQRGVVAALENVRAALEVLQNKIVAPVTEPATVQKIEQQLAQKEAQARHESEALEALLNELNLTQCEPASWPLAARAEYESLQVTMAVADTELQDELQQDRVALRQLDDQCARLEGEQARRKAELETLSRLELLTQIESLEKDLTATRAEQESLKAVRATLQSQALPTTSSALHARLEVMRSQLQNDQKQLESLATTKQNLISRCEAVAARAREYTTAWTEILQEGPPATPVAAMARLHPIQKGTEAALADLKETELQEQEKEHQREQAELSELVITRRHQQDVSQRQQENLRGQLGSTAEETRDCLVSRLPELAHATQHERHGWQEILEDRQNAVRDNRSKRRAAAQAMGLDEETLNLSEAETALAQAEKSIAVKRRAGEIVARTRQSIVNRVMPLTMQNMRQLLPLLTDGRYQDVMWDEENNYLAVYDSRAHAFHRKRVFSGGARDQISLALRLAFALATLPGEHNVRPGWLFLDEPLSSFDRSRTQALVDLLTRGLVRHHFSQIFLVSHSESFDPGQFDYRLRLESGRIIENTLP